MKRIGLLCVLLWFVAACSHNPGVAVDRGIVPLPGEVQTQVDTACAKFDGFKADYVRVRPQVVEHSEWFRELVPEFWALLVDFDKNAANYEQIFTLVCRVLVGDRAAQQELDAVGVAMQRRGVDWVPLLNNATKLATLLLAGI